MTLHDADWDRVKKHRGAIHRAVSGLVIPGYGIEDLKQEAAIVVATRGCTTPLTIRSALYQRLNKTEELTLTGVSLDDDFDAREDLGRQLSTEEFRNHVAGHSMSQQKRDYLILVSRLATTQGSRFLVPSDAKAGDMLNRTRQAVAFTREAVEAMGYLAIESVTPGHPARLGRLFVPRTAYVQSSPTDLDHELLRIAMFGCDPTVVL